MAEVYVTERAKDALEDLESDVQSRIKKKLRDISDWPDHYLKPLSGRDDYSVRIGDYRALIEWDRDGDVLYVKSVGHRRNFYDREL
ncbi:type II toxin-antitoxin system RelE family toxin [Halococcoides cellulosivorans]|uniref:Cytotoxic translational repressor of toxin-antitoxin stability system n=1 Tax=Halococcoides cellulosivorans TaxID=1679096 RepID=A0A2R4WYI2_9EURY|nr:type II toxin-antitoxin system RelE/ParE family toxin [Halococcoides cellulosivorans]AWB26581.1 cytotoxic translational repressor of toxin-antitoxin stability system [Halococcoides cellulosivorans]